MRTALKVAVLALCFAKVTPAFSQQLSQPAAPVPSGSEATLRAPIVTLDRDRLYAESDLGKAAEADFQKESAALIAENRQLEAALEKEERDLTTQRDSLPADQFRQLAKDFDTKVEELRKAQDAKSRDLNRRHEELRQAFFQKAIPVLGRLMVDINAVAIIDRSAIILTFDQLDITNLAIARMNSEMPPSQAAPAPQQNESTATDVQPAPGSPAPDTAGPKPTSP